MSDWRQRIANLSPAQRAVLERRLMQVERTGADSATIPRRGTSAPCPLSFAQQRLWFLAQLEPHTPIYNEPKALHIRGALHVEALQSALTAIVSRHEVLRTTFTTVDGSPVQVLMARQDVELPVIDLRAWSAAARAAEIQRRLNEAIRRPFDLSRDLMLRALVLQLQDEEHVLLLVTHHIACDGWSIGILLQELTALYDACATGRSAALPELPIQYTDYALWQRQWLDGDRLEAHLAYWKRQLAGAPAVLDLPTDRPRPAIQTFRGARQAWVLPAALVGALKALSQQAGVTLFMVLLAALQTLLYRYTGQEDIVVGSPSAGRIRRETEGLIGFFVNTLVLRTDLSGSPTFRELLGRVREVTFEAQAHQECPFEKLVEKLQPARRLSHTPLVQVMFAFQNVPQPAPQLLDLTLSPLEVERGIAKFDLTLFMWDTEHALRGAWEYSTDLFDADTIARLSGHFQTLLENLVADPDQMITTVPILTAAERHQVLVAWNATQTDYPREVCIHALFAAQVERTPDAVVVVCGDTFLTYQELDRQANQLAHTLQALGVGPDVLVGICMERSVEMIVGLLGILKAGGVYVPLDPAYPQERLGFMLEDTQAPVLVTHRRLCDRLPVHQAQVVCLDTDWQQTSQAGVDTPRSGVTAAHLAYVLYTSGSTGRPKGVAVPHRAVHRLVCHTNYVRLEPADVVAQVSNYAFDAATFEIWGALVHGARLVVLTTDIVLAPRDFATHLTQHGISVLFLTTALFNQVARDVPTAFRTVRALLFGGEAVEPHWVREVLRHGPPERLLHVYGPTETTTFASWYLVEHIAEDAFTVPIGRPIADTQLYLLDTHLQPVPIGVPGELYIGGDGLARGYLHDPELTAERFIPHPWSTVPGARLYKTGDLVRYRPDGHLEFLGRLDHQVKIRGLRIELGEIEAVLGRHPAVRDAVVVVQEAAPGDRRLVAYCVYAQESVPGLNALRDFLRAQLPDYMVPAVFVRLDTLPLTPNGKVDRRALPASDWTSRELEHTFVAPRDRLEYQIVKTWEQVLGIQPIGVQDNFFALGGHSLLAVRLCARLEQVCRTAVPLMLLFQVPTVAQLAHRLRQEGWSAPPSRLLPYRPGGSKPPFFCVHGVERMASALDAEQPFYALHPHALDGQRAPHTIEAMAADYLKDIQTVQPEGPYFLGGGSVGGLIAFEMVQQLHRQGQAVACLILIDPTSPGNGTMARGTMTHRIKGVGRKLATMGVGFCLARRRLAPARLRMPYFIEVSLRAACQYTPQLYAGRAIFFKAAQRAYDPLQEWGSLVAGGVEIYEMPGDHFSMFKEPHVQVVAERLALCLHQVQARGHTGVLPDQPLVTTAPCTGARTS